MNIREMHGHLCDRRHNLWATPVHISIKPGRTQMRLEPLKKEMVQIAEARSFIPILLRIKEQLDSENIDDLRHWLTHDIPRSVAGLEVFDTAEKIHVAVEDLSRGQKLFAQRIDEDSKDEIIGAWARVVDMTKQYQSSASQTLNRTSKSLHTREFARQIDAEVHSVLELLERAVLLSPGLDNPEAMDQVVEDETMRSLDMSDKLHMRKLARLSHESTQPDFREPSHEGQRVMQETKKYGPYIDPGEMDALTARLADLVRLLNASKSADFRSLKCIGCTHQPHNYSYILEFEIPPGIDDSKHNSLHNIIRNVKGQDRPSLNERLRMSLCLARALYQWHLVGWLHEGISGFNVIFFNRENERLADYSNPFLHGFEFARPDSDPSIGRAMDDIDFNVYRHPDRQGSVRKGHKKKHDLYSLGVVMLEIGLWQTASSMIGNPGSSPYSPQQIQGLLRKHCKERLAHFAGESYSAAVYVCLSSQFGADVDDEMGSGLLKAFQEKVISELSRGVMI